MTAARPGFALAATPDIRHAARRLRWFAASFHQQVEILSADSGVAFEIDDRALARVFLAWLRRFEAHKDDARDLRDFTHFAAGAMLRELIRGAPLRAVRLPPDADSANPAYYWPEGYAYLAYCMNVCEAVLLQEFDARVALAPELDDIETWWSFRETTREDSRWAIAFFDKLSGVEPNWDAPELFFARHAVARRLGGAATARLDV